MIHLVNTNIQFWRGLFFIELYDRLRVKLKDNVYKVLNSWEALKIGYIINHKELDLGFKDLFQTTYNNLLNIIR